jgi:BolA protein
MALIKSTIVKKLEEAFSPIYLDVLNESSLHNVPDGAESHFKVVIVSQCFNGQSNVKRHQSVYATLALELQSGIHALSIHTYLPIEWKEQQLVSESPSCLNGSKKYN